MTFVEMRVNMDCSGCEKRVRKALRKLKGVEEVEVDMAMQKVTVTGWADQEKVLKAVRKTGKRADLWPAYRPGDSMYDYHYYYYGYDHTVPAEAAAAGAWTTGYDATQQQHPAPAYSSYDYHPHGYNGFQRQEHLHGGGGGGGYPAIRYDARSAFSDDNPHACSIM